MEPSPGRHSNDRRPLSTPAAILELSPSSLNLADLELLHHFTTTTCFTFSSDPLTQTLWRINAPQLGLRNEFVLHSILAVAALHLAHLKPRSNYIAQALVHHRASSTIARPMVSDITSGNCSSLFLFSVLTSYFAFAAPRVSNSIPAWLFLIQGTRSILEKKSDAIKTGMFSIMVLDHQHVKALEFPSSSKRSLPVTPISH